MEQLEAFLEGHLEGNDGPGLVLILGQGGIGKSRLLAELGGMARRKGIPVQTGFCHETGVIMVSTATSTRTSR